MTPAPPPPPEPSPSDLRQALAAWLAASQAASQAAFQAAILGAGARRREPVAEAGEAEALAQEARRLEALGAEADPSPEADGADVRLLGDLGAALVACDAPDAAAPSAALRAAARQAFAASLAASAAPTAGADAARAADLAPPSPALRVLRGTGGRPASRRAGLGWAALLLVGLGAGALLLRETPPSAPERPALRLAGIDRFQPSEGGEPVLLASDTRSALALGERLVAAPGEWLQVRLADGGRVLLDSGRALEVVEVASGPGGGGAAALLRVAGGEALLDSRAGPVEVLLASALDGRALGVLRLERGPAHVASGLGPSGEPVVALLQGGQAAYAPVAGAAQSLRGPAHLVLAADGPSSLGEPERALFAALEHLGAPLPAASDAPFVEARRWRVVGGLGQRGGLGLGLRASAPAPGAGVPEAAVARVTWLPDASVAGARVLRLTLQGPADLEAALPDLGVAGRLPAPAPGAAPGPVTLELPLPEGWARALPAEGLAVELRWPQAAATAPVRFDGAWFAAQARSTAFDGPRHDGAGAAPGPRPAGPAGAR